MTDDKLRHAAVLAGIWPASDVDAVPAAILDAGRRWHAALSAAAGSAEAVALKPSIMAGDAAMLGGDWPDRTAVTGAPDFVERGAFEKAMASLGYHINPGRHRDGSYRDTDYSAGWSAWQARAALSDQATVCGSGVSMASLRTEPIITDAEIAEAFKGTNFGAASADPRRLLALSVLKAALRYHCGHTITQIMLGLGLIAKRADGHRVTERGRRFCYEEHEMGKSG